MAYTVRSILGKTRLHRPDLREAEIDYLTQEIVRRICRLTMLAQNEITISDISGPIEEVVVTDPNGNNINRIHLVKWQDSYISKPNPPTLTATAGTGFSNDTRHNYSVVAKSGQGWISRHSELASVITTGGNNQVTVTMPSIPNAPNGFDHFDLYRIDTTVANDKVVTGISIASQAVVTCVAHGYSVDDNVTLFNVAGMTQINGKLLTITEVTTNTFTVDLDTTNSSKYSIYTSGGVSVKTPIDQFRLCNTGFSNINQGNITTGIDTNNTYAGVNGSNVNYVNFETSLSTLPTEATGDYRILGEGNYVDVDNNIPKNDAVFGNPSMYGWDAITGKLKLWPPVSEDNTESRLKITYSYIPVGEIDEIPLLPESEEAVYYGTLAEAYMLAGPAQNLSLAKNYELKFNYEMSNLKGIALLGQSGRLAVIPRPLGGRKRTTYTAFGSPWSSSWGW
jgi:hypothetical protein